MVPLMLYERLRELARLRYTEIYSRLAPLAGIDARDPLFAVHVGEMLDEVDAIEHAPQRPLLSAVAIAELRNKPGPGSFTIARHLGVHTECDDDRFWINELHRVYDYWSRP